MIQDIFPNHFSLDYQLHSPSCKDAVILIHKNKFYLTPSKTFPLYETLTFDTQEANFIFLFTIDSQKYFLADFSASYMETFCSTNCEKGTIVPLTYREIRVLKPMYIAFVGYTAWHLYSWYHSNRFCGCCGAKMSLGTNERKLVCPSCHGEVFPRINPAVIVAVHDGDRLLMTKYARPGSWFVLIAGFVEIGETAEDTVHREVMEETGVKVKNIRYFGSQPWGISGNLTLGYTAELDGSDEITLETNELSAGRWFHRDEVPVPDDDVSITAAMIRAFVANQF